MVDKHIIPCNPAVQAAKIPGFLAATASRHCMMLGAFHFIVVPAAQMNCQNTTILLF